ncbi:glycoside hydrolase family 6 protein [Ceratobasidium sp. AG-Ba]|nr:glycoside hydrolase family 6 protein [Ceratobasidium sp. AG-Ba]QRW01298.1 glycoside hydrolase family 6 protein [Ceratobasidium sp. AG-Ba]
MKFTAALAIALSANGVFGHYIFNKLIINGTPGAVNQYIRPVPNNSPVTSVTSTDVRCNVGGGSGSGTSTATVSAGSTVGFVLDNTIYHAGPLAVYLGKAPSSAASWDGSGANWFKIYELGATFNPFKFLSEGKAHSLPPCQSTFNFKIPSSIPAGEYLLRIEQIGLHVAGAPQWYISCAQLKITGGGSANPSKVSIPGYVSASDPGLTVNIYNPVPTSYKVPGPSVFSG